MLILKHLKLADMKKHLFAIALMFVIAGEATLLVDNHPSKDASSVTNNGTHVLGITETKSNTNTESGKCGEIICSPEETCINRESAPICVVPRALPNAKDDAFETTINTAIKGDVLKNDGPSKDMTVKTVQDVTHGRLILKDEGVFTYMPEKDYSGKDSFTYKTCLAETQCSHPATVTIEIQ